jgi:hypothetical protein
MFKNASAQVPSFVMKWTSHQFINAIALPYYISRYGNWLMSLPSQVILISLAFCLFKYGSDSDGEKMNLWYNSSAQCIFSFLPPKESEIVGANAEIQMEHPSRRMDDCIEMWDIKHFIDFLCD